MPVFVYRGTERVYPESCDSYGVPLGTVKPGDVLRLDQAPDQFWAPYEDGEPSSGPEPPREMRAPYTYLGSDDRRYMDYADASTGRMLEVTPGGGDGGVYDVVRRDPAFPDAARRRPLGARTPVTSFPQRPPSASRRPRRMQQRRRRPDPAPSSRRCPVRAARTNPKPPNPATAARRPEHEQ